MSAARALVLIVGVVGGLAAPGLAADDAGRAAVLTDEMTPAAAPACPTQDCPGESHHRHWWASADYVFGWLRGASAPPLLSAQPVGGGPPTVLFPNGRLNDDGRSGFQLRGGLWLDQGETLGVEAGALYLCESSDRARVGNVPGTVIGRPFFNTLLGTPDVELVSVPGILSGQAVDIASSSHFCGVDVALRKAICCDCRGRLDLLVG